MHKLTRAEIPAELRRILKLQNGKCGICQLVIAPNKGVLDHCHTTGQLRGVLHYRCNGAEGKVRKWVPEGKNTKALIKYLYSLIAYLDREYYAILHPTHKTEEQIRLARNKKARQRRVAKAKAEQFNKDK